MPTVRVSFAELRTTGSYSNMRAEAAIETETDFPTIEIPKLFGQLRHEVREQIDAELRERQDAWERTQAEWRKRSAQETTEGDGADSHDESADPEDDEG